MGKPRPKLSDVAELAGVSASTASLVLAGKGDAQRISEEARRRVREAAASLNYAPSLLHRSVRKGRTGILSFFNCFRNREAGDLYMDRLAAAVEHAGGRQGYNVLVHCHFDQTVQEAYEFLNGGFADGLILFAPAPDEPLLPLLRESGLPTVLMNPRGNEPVLSTVRDDAEQGMSLLADALVEMGHRRIGIVAQQTPSWSDPPRRERVLRRRLSEIGVPESAVRTVAQHNITHADLDRILSEVLAEPDPPTAVFAWNDRTAYEFLDACDRAGVRVPEDLSVVGYDGIRWPSTSGNSVTSISPSLEELADTAVDILRRLMDGHEGPIHREIQGVLVPGGTLGASGSGQPAAGSRWEG